MLARTTSARVGRTWCHAGVPQCDGRVLKEVCPKAIGQGRRVRAA
jgi:hypothetical protein